MAQQPSQNLTETGLANALQENMYALFRAMQFLPGYEISESEKISCHVAFPPNPMFRGIWRARLAPEEMDTAVDEALAWFKQRRAPDLLWWTDANTQPPELGAYLFLRGFEGDSAPEPGMAIDLNALTGDSRYVEGLTIRQAASPAEAEDWGKAFSASYELPAAEGQAWVEATLQIGLENTPWQLYVGYIGDQPVASSLLFCGAGVAGIYAVGTVPSRRSRGIGAALTLRPLLDARKQGYHYSVLFASRLGYPVYLRMGFQEVPCQIRAFYYEVS